MNRTAHLLAGAAFFALAGAAQAQDAPAGAEDILVTGTRFSDRTVTTSPVPVDVLRGDELRTSGYQETTEVLRALAPSFAFATPTTPDGNTQIHAASLRGLSPDETLVLVNGKRLHAAAWVNTGGTIGKGAVPTDLNQIPVQSIGRVEILRDGASAQYGSDAIAGVINIILRDDTAIHGSASAGATYNGGGDTYELSLGGGFKLGDDGVLHVTGNYRDHKGANRALPDTRQFYFGIAPNGSLQPLSSSYGAGIGLARIGGVAGTVADPREATVNRNVWRFADEGDIKDASVIANLTKPLGGSIELYGFGGYRVSSAHSNASFRRPGQDEVVRAIFPDGFLPFVNTRSVDYSGSLGLRGDLAPNWKWDLSTVYGGNRIRYRTANTLNTTLGTASPTAFYDGAYADSQWTTDLTLSTEQNVGLASPLRLAGGVEFRRDGYKITPGEPNSYAYGPARILDGPNAGAVPTIGSQGFAGIQPGDAVDVHRNNVGAFLEGEIEPVAGWTINGAGRYEHYSDFGSTWNGQASTRIALPAGFAARASVGTGFHAPALAQQYFSSTSSRTLIVDGFPQYVLVRTAPPGSALAQALGAQQLKPEKSTNYSAGLTFARGSFTASADYYHIDIDNRIFLSSNYVDPTGSSRLRDYLTGIGIPGVTSVRYFTNAADSRTRGVDVTAAYRFDLGAWGAFNLSAAYNHNTTRLRRIAATPSQITALGITTPLFDIIERTRVERGQPRDKLTLGGNWKIGPITFDLRTTRYGEVEQVALTNQTAAQVALVAQGTTPFRTLPTQSGTAGNFDVIQKLQAKWVTDFSFTGQVTRNIAVTFGSNNIFNIYPTKNIATTTALSGADTFGVFPYSEFSPFGFSGAFYYARVGFSF